MTNWFEVDRKGLTEIAKRRGMSFIIAEPLQNAWDESTSQVTMQLTPVPGAPYVDITVVDDSPDGFRDLADSYLMFRESYKLEHPNKRGRFNLGEKLLLSMAQSARVTSTTGSVIFDAQGRRRGRKRTEYGSILEARLRMTRDELAEALEFARTLIPPPGSETTINGETLPMRYPTATTEQSLETEVRGEEGGFKYTTRKTKVEVYETLDGEKSHLYEMGIPIDEVDCPWHVNVCQKVPLSVDRASVRFGYLLQVQRIAAEVMADRMTEDESREAWVSNALVSMEDDDAVRRIVKQRFGKAVIYDPSSPESNKVALDKGYYVVKGGELGKFAWQTVKRAGAIQPAGKVFPVGIPVSSDGKLPEPRDRWTEDMERFAEYAGKFAQHVLGHGMTINFYYLEGRRERAFCGGGEIGINLWSGMSLLQTASQAEVDELLIHECAHDKVGDHLTHDFHRECCRIGARLREFEERLK